MTQVIITECPRCGQALEELTARYWLCRGCAFEAPQEELEEAAGANEILQCWREDEHRGEPGAGGSRSRQPRKPVPRRIHHPEQEEGGWGRDSVPTTGRPSYGAEDAALLGQLREWDAQGLSYREMARRLQGEGWPTQSGKSWTHKGVTDVLKRERGETRDLRLRQTALLTAEELAAQEGVPVAQVVEMGIELLKQSFSTAEKGCCGCCGAN